MHRSTWATQSKLGVIFGDFLFPIALGIFFFLVLLDNWLSIMFCDFVFLWVLVDFVFVCMRVCPYFFLVLFLSFLF